MTERANLAVGRVFRDADGDGVQETGESGVGGWTVFVDANADGILQANEKRATTNSSGLYLLTDLPAGRFRLALVLQTGYRRTSPVGGFYELTLGNDGSSAKHFGVR